MVLFDKESCFLFSCMYYKQKYFNMQEFFTFKKFIYTKSKLLKMLTRKVMQFAPIFLCTTVLVSEENKTCKVSQYQEFYSDIDLSSITVTQLYKLIYCSRDR